MAGKFIDLKAAAKQLGMTPEHLQELREAGSVHGYKDGTSWKFKPEEIQRLATALAADTDDFELSDSASLSGDDFERLLNVDAAVDADDDLQDSSILISGEQPASDDDSSSTVIGRDDLEHGDGSEIRLADSADDGSDVEPAGSSAKPAGARGDAQLADSADLSDELRVADDLEFESDEALMLGDDGDLSLSAGNDQDVLDDSDGSDLPLGADDSGIGLASPSDSGVLLQGESAAALELPEDDDMISLEDDVSASDDLTHLQQDEEFLLSPSDEMLGDESSDSGSQVIALDDSGAFESDEAVADLSDAESLLVPDEADALDVALEPIDEAAAVAARASAVGAGELAEAPYSAWNLVSLIFVVLLLALGGMLMADIVRNMWTWSGETGVAGGVASAIVEALGMN